jgi:hypothetical protein
VLKALEGIKRICEVGVGDSKKDTLICALDDIWKQMAGEYCEYLNWAKSQWPYKQKNLILQWYRKPMLNFKLKA